MTEIEQLQAQVASLIQRADAPPGLSLKKIQSLISASAQSITPAVITDETSVELADNASGTEDAWTTIASGAASTATRVRLRVDLEGGPATCSLRKENGDAE